MVRGLDLFRAHFRDFADRYVLIGGTACDLVMDEAGLRCWGTCGVYTGSTTDGRGARHSWSVSPAARVGGTRNCLEVGRIRVRPGVPRHSRSAVPAPRAGCSVSTCDLPPSQPFRVGGRLIRWLYGGWHPPSARGPRTAIRHRVDARRGRRAGRHYCLSGSGQPAKAQPGMAELLGSGRRLRCRLKLLVNCW